MSEGPKAGSEFFLLAAAFSPDGRLIASASRDGSVRLSDAATGTWLATIARNRAVEFYRSAKPTEELSEDLRDRNNSNSEAREILQTIRALPETYKETLILRLIEGMSGNEIAEQTGLTPESVRVNLHRGMKMLRQKLGIAE